VAAPAIVADLQGKYLFDADITSIMQHWQQNPDSYYGVRLRISTEYGGVYAPNDSGDGSGTMANLTVVTPEPTSLGLIAIGSMLALRR
jgi:hypothetical protein